MAEINWTRESEIWLEDIYDYIAADDPEVAERTVSLIYEGTAAQKSSAAWLQI